MTERRRITAVDAAKIACAGVFLAVVRSAWPRRPPPTPTCP